MKKTWQDLLFGLAFGLLYAFSLLPLWLLYGLSTGLYLLLYHVFRYRRATVRQNLARAFSQKTPGERRQLEREFYRHFCDVLVETVKSVSLRDAALARRVKLKNPAHFEAVKRRSTGSMILATHCGNFEWVSLRLDLGLQQAGISSHAVYARFRSRVFERLVNHIRTRRGLQLIPMRNAMITLLRLLKGGPCMVGIIADQSPMRHPPLYFVSLFGQSTAFYTSFAKIALKAQVMVYYADVRQQRRGHYEIELIPIDTADFLPYGPAQIHALTDHYAALLQATLEARPAHWLWSHRRWKHAPKEGDLFSPVLGEQQS